MARTDSTTSTPIRLVRLGRTHWRYTQSVYHAVAACMDESTPDTVILCQPDRPYFCLGYHQHLAQMFDSAALQKADFPVIRRKIGGGTTYLDARQLFYQFVFHQRRLPVHFDAIFQHLLTPAVALLQSLGLNAALRKINEIEVDGRRMAGTGGGQLGQACVVVGNVLADFDAETMVRFLHVPSPGFRELAKQAMQEQIATFRRLGLRLPLEDVERLLVRHIRSHFGRPVIDGELSAEERRRAEQLADKMTAPDYLMPPENGRIAEPLRQLKIAADDFIHFVPLQHQGRPVAGNFWVKRGTVYDARLLDEQGRRLREREADFIGLPFRPDEWRKAEAVDSVAAGAGAAA